jgi:hypothetical protein
MAININVENYNSNTYYTGENFSGATDFNFTNPADSTSYVIFQTISIDGKYTSVSPKNFLGTITNSTVVDTVVSPYVLAIVLPPGTSTFTFTPDTAVTGTTYNFRVSRRGAFQPNPPPPPTPPIDPDAEAFLTAAAITDATITSAVNTLVTDLKTANIWTKMHAIYPFVGGTATTHKWNLKNPLDTDAAFRLSFVGGWTHSSTGALPNGTNGYADTFFNTDDTTSTGLQSFGVYTRTNPTFAINAIEYPTGLRNGIYWIRINSTAPTVSNFRSGNRSENINGVTGFLAQSRYSTTQWYVNNNSINQEITDTVPSVLSPEITRTFTLAAYSNASIISNFSTQELSFAFHAEPLLTTEMEDFYNAIQTFQTTLDRNV